MNTLPVVSGRWSAAEKAAQAVTPATEKLRARAEAAWESLKRVRSYNEWLEIGEYIEAARADIMKYLGINDPASDSKPLKDAMGIFLRDNPKIREIGKTIRSRLHSCMMHRAEIEAWRLTLDANQRVALNHPNGVWNKFKDTLEDAVPKKRTKPTPNETIMALQEELDQRDKQIGELEAERDDLRKRAEKAEWEFAALKKAASRLQAGAEKLIAADERRSRKSKIVE